MSAAPDIRILLVADERVAAADLENGLRHFGYQVVGTSSSAEDALSATSEKNPDLVLIDLHPGADPSGIEVAETVCHNWDLPVVLLSDNSAQNLTERHQTARSCEILSKPFWLDDLHATILREFQQHRLSQGLPLNPPRPRPAELNSLGAPRHPSALGGESTEQLRAFSGHLLTAHDAELQRIAQLLHDDLGQRTALLRWRLGDQFKNAASLPWKLQHTLSMLEEELDQLSARIREISSELHPTVVAHLGLPAALESLATRYRATGADITLVPPQLHSQIPAAIATALYLIAQEALQNATRHAPSSPILVSLSSSTEEVRLRIQDPGPGFDMQQVCRNACFGLLSMQERARLLGGTLQILTAPGDGTTVLACVPLPATPHSLARKR